MSASTIPYHLRPNKFVDRQIFVEALQHVAKLRDFEDYAYISMGGKFLDDFKIVHGKVGIRRMLSIESDETAFARQNFNRPFNFIDCRLMTSGELVANFENVRAAIGGDNCVVWLDYTSARDRVEQLREYEALIAKLTSGDVVRITLNASLITLDEKSPNETETAYRKRLLSAAKEKLGDNFPARFDKTTSMTQKGFAELLAEAVKNAALRGVFQGAGGPKIRPLSLTRYKDGQQMLTATAIVLDSNLNRQFARKTKIKNWDHHSKDWRDIKEISVPDLSIKEKMEIDKDLFDDNLEKSHADLPFQLANSEQRSLEIYQNYREHYLRYPTYLRVET